MQYCHFSNIALALLVCLENGLAQEREEKLVILPSGIELTTHESRQIIVAQWQLAEQFEGQAAKGLMLESSDESVVRIEEGQAVPIGNGTARITATVDGKTAVADVSVSGMDKPFQ